MSRASASTPWGEPGRAVNRPIESIVQAVGPGEYMVQASLTRRRATRIIKLNPRWVTARVLDGSTGARRSSAGVRLSKSNVPDGLVSALDAALEENFHYA